MSGAPFYPTTIKDRVCNFIDFLFQWQNKSLEDEQFEETLSKNKQWKIIPSIVLTENLLVISDRNRQGNQYKGITYVQFIEISKKLDFKISNKIENDEAIKQVLYFFKYCNPSFIKQEYCCKIDKKEYFTYTLNIPNNTKNTKNQEQLDKEKQEEKLKSSKDRIRWYEKAIKKIRNTNVEINLLVSKLEKKISKFKKKISSIEGETT